MLLLAVVVVSALASWAAMRYAREQGLIDVPSERRSHDRPIARAGGLGPVLIFVSFCIGLVATFNATEPDGFRAAVALIAAATCVLAGLGFWDDHQPLPVSLRLAVQALVCGALVVGMILLLLAGVSILHGLLLGTATLSLVLGMLNAFNFMDGSHGMALTQGLFVSLVLATLFALQGEPMTWPAMTLAACLLGFFPFNFPRPRVFLGDVGSLGIGAALIGIMLYAWASGLLSWWELIVLMQVFLVDTGLTLLDRLRRGQQWYTSHRDHAYQRLLRHGWSHAGVLGLYLLLNLILTLPGLWLIQTGLASAQLVAAVSVLILGVGWVMIHKMTITSAQASS